MDKVAESVECRICKERIRNDAIKCMHCGSFQNWRRHLGTSSAFLSVVVALISVMTVFVAVFSDSLVKDDSNINASVINWQRTYFNDRGRMSQVLVVETFVTNSGKKPGAVVGLSVKGQDQEQFQYLRSGPLQHTNEYSHDEIKAEIIEPGKTLLLKKYLKTLLNVEAFENNYSNALLQLEIIEFSGARRELLMQMENSPPEFFR